MISTQKSRNKLLLQEEKIRHKNRKTQKTQKLILLFFSFSTVFPPLKHKLNTNWTQTKYKFNIKKKKRHKIHRAYWITEERGPWGCGWMTLSRLMRWRERERDSRLKRKNREKNYLRKAETFDNYPTIGLLLGPIETYASTSERDDSLALLKKWER